MLSAHENVGRELDLIDVADKIYEVNIQETIMKDEYSAVSKIALEKKELLEYANNKGSIIFLVGLPPRNVLISYATLDRMEKQCCSFSTDGEELKNNLSFLRRSTQCSIVFPSHQGQVPLGWLVYTSGSVA